MAKKLSLRPYPGVVVVCKDRAEFIRQCWKSFEIHECPSEQTQGRMRVDFSGPHPVFVLFASAPAYLAHELGHVVLCLFEHIGADPREANGEPFCYLLSQLMLEAE